MLCTSIMPERDAKTVFTISNEAKWPNIPCEHFLWLVLLSYRGEYCNPPGSALELMTTCFGVHSHCADALQTSETVSENLHVGFPAISESPRS